MMSEAGEVLRQARRRGYALWVGAGVSRQLKSDEHQPKLWMEFVKDLEKYVMRPPPPVDSSVPERLEACFRAADRYEFQVQLRDAFLEPVAEAILASAKLNAASVPPAVQQVANLGRFANPIVNFNVEHLSSRCLATPHGPTALRVFTPTVPGSVSREFRFEPHLAAIDVDHRFYRSVYHPHGALHSGGICVMTSSQYQALNGTLALELATHLAFDQDLLIVGMSLEDAYLRDQILRFREHIRQIYWFGSEDSASLSTAIQTWVWKANVSRVKVEPDWADFWAAADAHLDRCSKTELLNLLVAWHNTVLEAMSLLSNPKSNWLKATDDRSTISVSDRTEAMMSALNSGENPEAPDRDDLATQDLREAILRPMREEIERKHGKNWKEFSTPLGYIQIG